MTPTSESNWRNKVTEKLCNFLLRHVATPIYRDWIDGSIRLGLRTAAEKTEGYHYINVHALSGAIDASLDGLGHTDVQSIDWLMEFLDDEASS